MRKYLWGGAILIVAGAASVYVGTDFVLHHPESAVARASAALANAAVNSNPLSVMNRSTTGTDTVRRDDAEVAGVTFTKPLHSGEAEETIEPIQVDAVPPAQVEIAEGDVPAPDNAEESSWPFGVTGTVASDVPVDETPRPMPYAEVEPTLIDRILAHFTFEVGTEECEFPETNSWVESLIGFLHLGMNPVECSAELIPVLPEEDADEDQTDVPAPQQTQEPSYYHHHYEGCPYMGGCHYCPPAVTEQSPVKIPSIKKPILKIRKPWKVECHLPAPMVNKPLLTPTHTIEKPVLKTVKPCKPEIQSSLEKLLQRTSQRCSYTIPFVDTMEFRPSDAGNYPISNSGPF